MATLDLQCYRGPDAYSDGAVEDELLELAGRPDAMADALRQDTRWPILYHLSPERRTLLEWVPFRPDAAVLEVGAGCGALTGLLAERAARVTAVDLSARRARIVARRHEAASNLTVRAGNVMDMPFDEPFDYVTLIGVLEYSRLFIPGPDAARALLRRLAGVLKPGGLLLVAVENRFGLKYFAGARDDHTGRLFDGLEDFPAGGAETFSRPALERLLAGLGFGEPAFYYPCPDYKFPSEIFSDAWLPDPHHVFPPTPNYDQERLVLFDEALAWRTILREGVFPFFANSFLVLVPRAA